MNELFFSAEEKLIEETTDIEEVKDEPVAMARRSASSDEEKEGRGKKSEFHFRFIFKIRLFDWDNDTYNNNIIYHFCSSL